jgi:hypothetical protein
MSASRFAPDEWAILDLGNAMDVVIDGIASQVEINGIIRTVYYTSHVDLSGLSRVVRVASLRTHCSMDAYRVMERQRISASLAGDRGLAVIS